MNVIEVEYLTKDYSVAMSGDKAGFWRRLFQPSRKRVRALDALSISVPAGQIVGLLGSNGAGKTTAIKCLTGILTPDSGSVRVLGFDPHRERERYTRHIGLVMGQKSLLLWDVPVIESLKLYRDIYEVPDADFRQRLEQYTEMLDLGEFLRKPVRKLSLGQRMRAEFVAALLHQPDVIFLDEPTIGLDVLAKDRIRRFLQTVNRQYGTTVILTTHDMRDVEALCDRVLLLEKGQLVYDGTVTDLKELQQTRVLHLSYAAVRNSPAFERVLAAGKVIDRHERDVRVQVGQQVVLEVLQTAMGALDLTDVTIEAPSLEQIMQGVLEQGFRQPGAPERGREYAVR